MLCRWCGQPIRKWTKSVYVAKEPTSYHTGHSGRWVYYGDGAPPRSIADCQRFSNQQVISIRRNNSGVVSSFGEWDGETYMPNAGFFCTNDCAMALGKAAARDRNLCGAGYNEAIKRQQEKVVAHG